MDYDDNDFHSNHFQLGVDDNSTFPLGLRSFSLPKFDLDEQLQVHLRFDSLVEAEDLLGFQGQEGSNWIDEFSSGSRAIEFSSGDSCSISRRNNVWSEATSSESVEMLLKSVGEDGMITNKTNTDPDPQSVLHDTNDNMASCLQNDESNVDDVLKAELTPVSDEGNNCLSAMGKDTTNVSSYDKGAYQASGDEKSGHKESSTLDVCSGETETVAVGDRHFTENVSSSVKYLENDMVEEPLKKIDMVEETSSFDESYHNGPQGGGPLDHVFLADNALNDHVASSLTKETSNLDLSDHVQVAFDSPIMDPIVSSGPSSQLSDKDFAVPKVPDTLMEGPREKSQALQIGKTDCCQPEGLALGCSFNILENHPPSGTHLDSSVLLVGDSGELAFSKKSDGLLEVIVDQMTISNKKNDISSKVLSASKESSVKNMEAACSLEAHPIEKIKETSGETYGTMVEIVSPIEKRDDSQERSNEVDHGCGGRELGDYIMLTKEKQNLGNCPLDMKDDNNDEKEIPGFAVNIPCVINRMDGLQIAEINGHENLESHHEVVTGMGSAAGHELTTDVGSSEEILNKSVELNLKDVKKSWSNDNNCKETCPAGAASAVDIVAVTSESLPPVEVPSPSVDSGSVVPGHDGCTAVAKKPDTSLQVHDTSSVCVGSFKKLIAEDESEEADQVPGETPVAGIECKEMAVSTLSVSDSIPLDRYGGKFSQSSKESCLPALESGDSSNVEFLPLPVSNSECTITPVKLQRVPIEKHSMGDAVQSGHSDEFHSSLGPTLTTECVDEETACIASSEVKENSEFDKPCNTSEKHGMEESSIPVDGVHSMDKSIAHVNSSKCTTGSPLLGPLGANTCRHDKNCGSPTVGSKHSHDKIDKQDSMNVLSDKTDPISSILLGTSDMERNAGQGNIACETTEECKTSKEDKSFTVTVGQPAQQSEKAVDGWKPVLDTQTVKSGPEVLATAGLHQSNSNVLRGVSQGSQLLFSDGKVHDVVVKGIGKEKRRLVTPSTSSSKRKTVKESQLSKKTSEISGKSYNPSPSSVRTITRDVQSKEIQQCSIVEGSSKNPSSSVTVQSSSLPDLNTAASPASFINRPVTDAQQVQLRAQIFVYGSIIQGIPPDEACMLSAFGDADGGRTVWEGVWRAVTEKYLNQKSPICKTPASLPVIRSVDQASSCSLLQSKASNILSCRTGNKSPSSTNLSTSLALPSPVWSMSTCDVSHRSISRGSHLDPTRILSPLHAYHTPQGRHFTCNDSSGLAQPPYPVSLVPSAHTSVLHTTPVSTSCNGAVVQLQHNRDISVPLATNLQFMTSSTLPSTGVALSASATPPLQMDVMSPSPTKHISSDQKPRKRKKSTGPEAHKHISLISQPQLEPVSHILPPKAAMPGESPARTDGVTPSASPIISPTHFQIVTTGCSEHKVIFSEETCTKIEQAKLHAEDAAAFASAAIMHSQGIWSQLATQRNSGLVSEVEQKLVCAAAAAAAAASVAKAAAAAAKVAADSALHAKMVADVTVTSSRAGNTTQGLETGRQNGETSFNKVESSSTLKSNELTNNACSIISAAKEGSRKRVEEASAAAKRAENLDAILKAAELAAGAVSQAGAIVTLGDPLPFSLVAILDAGPEDYWKPLSQAKQHAKADGLNQPTTGFDQFLLGGNPILQTVGEENADLLIDISGRSVENCGGDASGNAYVEIPAEGNSRELLADDGNDSNIQEGSFVEVSSDDKGLEGVWYSARVVSLKDGQAYVCYNTLLADDGSGKVKSWIPLKGEREGAPRIRIAHPLTTVSSEGTKKRRREVVGNYVWNVGDRVDAWIRDGWWEGIITEKSIEDETKLTIHLSAGGDSSVVRSWDLRPSLVWENGEWMEWSRSKENKLPTNEGDTPREKRQKLSKHGDKNHSETEISGAPKACRHNTMETLRNPDEHAPLALSAKEKNFSVGLVVGNDNHSERIERTGLHKEGPRVIFGVPKPGKKRKFMDVTKHCVVDNTEKGKDESGSIKFPKYLTPQPQSSHGWKTIPRVDTRGKRAAGPKPKMLKSAKSQTVRTTSNVKESSATSIHSASSDGVNAHGISTSPKASAIHAKNKLEKKNLMEVGVSSNSGETAGHVLVSQLHPVPNFPSGKNSSAADAGERAERGKQAHAAEKPSRNNDKDSGVAVNSAKINFGSSEPRRSNRRIQPTSRLLEGLQSSLMISKIPSLSHDKGTKAVHRGAVTPRGRSHV